MKQKYVLTKYQKRIKKLLDDALLNPDFYQELGYVRRDYHSVLAINKPGITFNERLLGVMAKYKVPVDCYDVLSKFCTIGGKLDVSLIYQLKDSKRKPDSKSKPQANLHWQIYKMSIQQLMSVSEITDKLREQGKLHGLTRIDDINLVSHVVKRMNESDVNRDKRYIPTSGKRPKKM